MLYRIIDNLIAFAIALVLMVGLLCLVSPKAALARSVRVFRSVRRDWRPRVTLLAGFVLAHAAQGLNIYGGAVAVHLVSLSIIFFGYVRVPKITVEVGEDRTVKEEQELEKAASVFAKMGLRVVYFFKGKKAKAQESEEPVTQETKA
jgi:hypothetical protein